MLSNDLENLASALQQISAKNKDENTAFFEVFYNNLKSLAQRVYMLECMAVIPEAHAPKEKHMPIQ